MVNLLVAAILGLFISVVYKNTHRGLSYSQSFMVTIILVTVIVSMVMMVIGNNIARAFALVGALSNYPVSDGCKRYKRHSICFHGSCCRDGSRHVKLFSCNRGYRRHFECRFLLHLSNYGTLHSTEFILRLRLVDTGKPRSASPDTPNIVRNRLCCIWKELATRRV